MASNFSFKALPVLALALFAAFCQATLGSQIKHFKLKTCKVVISRWQHFDETIEDDKINNWIEIDKSVKACRLGRKSFGILSDSLLKSRFTEMLCSRQCYNSCPNVADLYFNLAAGESVFLPKLCEAQGANTQRGLAEIRSSGIVAPGPASGVKFLGVAPTMPPL
ncbi:hypothetical protein Gotri_016940 [Gossypium trilobum]|uniref:PAR1 protein n=1 Tax=Gossypium trilobum TaxID=34281 RepID=A0A7J9E5J5_9ROSI|nr:hypothetical protein [Gossypium trilobum]